jgi:hypothetical protein
MCLSTNYTCTMGGVLSSDRVAEYSKSVDRVSRTAAWDHTPPRAFRAEEYEGLPDGNGQVDCCDRVAHAIVSSSLQESSEYEPPVQPSMCVFDALRNAVKHVDDVEIVKVSGNARSAMQCLSANHLLCAVLPVTEDILDGDIHCPSHGRAPFALIPVVVWAYSKSSGSYLVDVPLTAFDRVASSTSIRASHLFDDRSCDYYTVAVNKKDDGAPMFIP